jgi:RNA polymerase sigma-70 factor, ECF subfamily
MGSLLSIGSLLANVQPGDEQTLDQLLPLVYKELRTLAAHYLERGGPGHTLQPTALVHEAFVRMMGADTQWSGREHFMAVAAKAMRHVLVDFARSRKSEKRGGAAKQVDISIAGEIASAASRELRVLELDDLLLQLGKADARAARIAEMRLFGGMEQEQIANVLGISRTTVATDWQFARSWLASRVHADVKVIVKSPDALHKPATPEKPGA